MKKSKANSASKQQPEQTIFTTFGRKETVNAREEVNLKKVMVRERFQHYRNMLEKLAEIERMEKWLTDKDWERVLEVLDEDNYEQLKALTAYFYSRPSKPVATDVVTNKKGK